MSEVQALCGAIQLSSGQERRGLLDKMEEQLTSKSPSQETLLLGLAQSSSDVRQVVLNAIATDTISCSSAPARSFLAPIVDILRQSLRASSTSLSAIRLASSALKALSTLLDRNEDGNSLTSLEVQSLVDVVLATMAWGLTSPPQASVRKPQANARQWRGGPGTAFAFDRGDSQSSSWRDNKSIAAESRSSSASFNSQNSEMSKSAISCSLTLETDHSDASDGPLRTDSDERQEKLREARRGVRYRSIGCLNVMNAKYTRLLLLHWPRLLLDAEDRAKSASLMDIVERDNSLSNRLTAVHAVQAYLILGAQAGFMAGAEEGSRSRAFTSLSSRMASMLVDLRRRLLSILASTETPSSLLEAVLKCSRTLVISTPLVKLRASHSQVLREMTLALCSRPEAACVVPAYALLSALVASDKGGGKDSAAGESIIATLRDESLPMQVRIEAWNAMTALAEHGKVTDGEEWTILIELLRLATAPNTSLELRQAAASLVQACVTHRSMEVDDMVLKQMYNDDSAIIRSIAADCLILLPGEEDRVFCLLSDTDSTVRASTVRAVGVKIQSEGKAIFEEKICSMLRDESLLVRMRASWSVGNLCEVSKQCLELLSRCYSLRDDDERVAVNAIRGIGALLSRCDVSGINNDQTLIESVLNWLLMALEEGGPKLRWNAAACLARSLTSASTCHLLAALQDFRLASTLSRVIVQEKAFKVRLSAVQALLRLTEHKDLVSDKSKDEVKWAVGRAIEKIGDQISQASFKEAQLHATPLQQSLIHLSNVLQSNEDV